MTYNRINASENRALYIETKKQYSELFFRVYFLALFYGNIYVNGRRMERLNETLF